MTMMQAQLACVLLLCVAYGGLCTDVDQEQRALEQELQLLSSLFTSKMKQNKQSAPYWHLSMTNLCRMVSSLRRPYQEVWSGEEGEELGEVQEGRLEELYGLQRICQALQPREERLLHNSLEYLDGEQNSDNPLKRKSPYILKRQVHTAKSRRPYILKRSTFY